MSSRPVRPESGLLRPLSASRSRRSLTRPDDELQDPERWRKLSGSGQHFQDDDDEHLLLHQTVLASKKQQLEHQHERVRPDCEQSQIVKKLTMDFLGLTCSWPSSERSFGTNDANSCCRTRCSSPNASGSRCLSSPTGSARGHSRLRALAMVAGESLLTSEDSFLRFRTPWLPRTRARCSLLLWTTTTRHSQPTNAGVSESTEIGAFSLPSIGFDRCWRLTVFTLRAGGSSDMC